MKTELLIATSWLELLAALIAIIGIFLVGLITIIGDVMGWVGL